MSHSGFAGSTSYRNHISGSCLTLILIICTVTSACSTKDKEAFTGTPFENYIAGLDKSTPAIKTLLREPDIRLHSPAGMVLTTDNQLVINNAPGWEVNLIGIRGEILSTEGGTGRGVNEFEMINSLQISSNDVLYALDKRSHEVEVYSAGNNTLTHRETIVLPNYELKRIESIVLQNGVWFGLFRKSNIKDPEGQSKFGKAFELYKLDEKLMPDELLLELPPNEVIPTIAEGVFQDNPFGFKTKWHFIGSTFLYANTSEFKLTSFDLETGNRKEYLFDDIPERNATDPEKEFILRQFKTAAQFMPTFKEDIEERKVFPNFQSFGMNDNYVFFQIMNYSDEPDRILKIDLKTNQKEVVEVPNTFSIKQITRDAIYGIDFDPEDPVPVKIELEG